MNFYKIHFCLLPTPKSNKVGEVTSTLTPPPKAPFTISVSCSIYKPREITTMRITTKMKTKGTSLTIQCYGSSTKGKAENEFLKERIKATCPELISSFPPTSDSG